MLKYMCRAHKMSYTTLPVTQIHFTQHLTSSTPFPEFNQGGREGRKKRSGREELWSYAYNVGVAMCYMWVWPCAIYGCDHVLCVGVAMCYIWVWSYVHNTFYRRN